MNNFFIRKKYLWVFISVLSVLILLLIAVSFGLRKIIQSKSVHDKLIAKITEKTNSQIDFEKIDIFLIPSPHITVYKGSLKTDVDFKAECEFESIEIYPKILPLIEREVSIKYIEVNNPKLLLTLPGKQPKTPENKKDKLSFMDQFNDYYREVITVAEKMPLVELEINGGKIQLIKDNKDFLHLSDVDTRYRYSDNMIEVRLSTRSDYAKTANIKFRVSTVDPKADAELKIDGLDPQFLSGTILKDSDYKIEKSEIDIDMRLGVEGPGNINGEIKSDVFSLNLLNKDAPFKIIGKNLEGSFRLDDEKKLFSIKKADFQTPELNLSGEYLIDNKNNKVSLKIVGNDVDIISARNTTVLALGQYVVTEKYIQSLKAGNISHIEFFSESEKPDGLFNDENFSIDGYINKGELYIPELDLNITNINGSISVKNGTVYAEDLSVRSGKTTVTGLTGNYTWGNDTKLKIASMNSDISMEELYDKFSKYEEIFTYLQNYKDAEGTIKISDLNYSRKNDASKDWNLSFKSDGTIYNEEKLKYSLGFERTPGNLKIENLKLKDENTNAEITLVLSEKSYNIDYSGRLAEKTTNRYLSDYAFSFGWIEGDITINYLINDASKSTANGTLKGQKIVFPFKPEVPVKIEEVSLNAANNKINIETLNLLLEDEQIDISGNLYANAQKLNLDLDASAEEIDWDGLSKYFGESPGSSTESSNPESENRQPGSNQTERIPVEGNVKFNVSKFKYGSLYISPLQGEIGLNGDNLNIEFDNASVCEITTNGIIGIKEKNMELDIDANTENEKIEDTLDCLFGQQKQIHGDYDFQSEVKGNGEIDNIKESLNGEFELIIKKGKLTHENPFLLSILKVANITEIYRGKLPDFRKHGLEFSTINIKGNIENGVIRFKDAELDSQYVGILFGGRINLVDESYNLKFNVAVFKTVHDVVEKVPLIKRLKAERLLSIPVRVKGKIDQPETIESYKE